MIAAIVFMGDDRERNVCRAVYKAGLTGSMLAYPSPRILTPARLKTALAFPIWVHGRSNPYAQPLWVREELILTILARMAASAKTD